MRSFYFSFSFLVILAILFQSKTSNQRSIASPIDLDPVFEQDSLFLKGQVLYKRNCIACHASSPKGVAGHAPNLVGVQMRWKDYPKEDLFNFIRNSQEMIQEEHPKAVKVAKQWNGVMTAYPELSDEDISSLLYFVEKEAYQKE
ncbi:MAG: cytochrome c [Cyanothece sp. SIO1E1]|nr:cytochrome c [Cyanothece sp. SIO1E1]